MQQQPAIYSANKVQFVEMAVSKDVFKKKIVRLIH